MKIAVIHDWLVNYAGSEKVLEEILEIFPDADLFSLVDYIENRKFIKNKKVTTTFIQRLPFAKKRFRNYLPLMPIAIEQLNLSEYDLVISSSHAVAKGVITGPSQLHISYIHSPIRYAWDLQHQYLKESNLESGIKGIITKYILHKIRNWDYRTANGVDYFISNSHFISKRIWKVYRRNSLVIYPPVDVDSFEMKREKEDYYFTASRMVPYKKMDIIVEAFSKMPDKKLIVIGDGPDYEKIKEKASSNIILMGYQPFEVLKQKMQKAKAFVFAAEEDFGITPVEAQACGTPVIAYGKGGSLETVLGIGNHERPTGIYFYEQTSDSIIEAVQNFERSGREIVPEDCRRHAETFGKEVFKHKFGAFVEEMYNNRFSLNNIKGEE